MPTTSEGSPEIASALQAFATATQAMLSLQEKQTVALGRIADALERANAITQHDPEVTVIRVADIRAADRDAMLGYSKTLGVEAWAERQGVDLSGQSNKTIRTWCLMALAGDDLEV